MLDEIRERIEGEIEELTYELNVELPEKISKAVEMGDLSENAEYESALDRQQFVQSRIQHLRKRAGELSKIDVDAMPYDRVGFGSKVKVKDLDLDEVQEFTIVAGDFMDLDAGHISLASPVGRGLLGAQVDEKVAIQLPRGEKHFEILDLTTLPQQLDLDPEKLEK